MESLQFISQSEAAIPLEFEELPPRESKLAVVVNCSRLNVRQSPSATSLALCTVNSGGLLLVEDVNNSWAHVYTGSGIEGYVMEEYIK